MKKWSVKLKGEEYQLDYLVNKVNSPNLSLIKEDGCYYLEFSDLKNAKNQDEARLIASEFVNNINRILRVDLGLSNIRIDEIICEENGKSINSMSATLLCTVSIIPSKPNVEFSMNYGNILKCIKNDKKVEDALIFYFLEVNWHNLFKVWETIESDVNYKDIIKNGWASKREIDLFRCSAHNREASGYHARHAVPKMNKHCKEILSTSKPMKLGNANKLIREILISWINSKNVQN